MKVSFRSVRNVWLVQSDAAGLGSLRKRVAFWVHICVERIFLFSRHRAVSDACGIAGVRTLALEACLS